MLKLILRKNLFKPIKIELSYIKRYFFTKFSFSSLKTNANSKQFPYWKDESVQHTYLEEEKAKWLIQLKKQQQIESSEKKGTYLEKLISLDENENEALIYAHRIKPITLFHMVTPSPWPFVTSLAAFTMMNGSVMFFHSIKGGNLVMFLGLILVIFAMIIWWRDVIREATFEGHHTKFVQRGLRYGMILFIVSEIMFFFAFFWAFFHSSLAPSVEIGSIWPPEAIHTFNPWQVPLLNTIILLSSGATVTWAHASITAGIRLEAIYGLIATVFLALIFTALQVFEYQEASFSIADGIYGSTFYMATGFHGFHVIIGTIFLTVCLIRLIKYHFTITHHFGFEAAAWYWHFVDVVWLFLFVTIYWWGTL